MSNIKLFEDKKIRTSWDAEKEEWFFSVVDVVSILTDKTYDDARKYWKVLKGRLKNEGSELVSFCYQLKIISPNDNKKYNTDVLDTKGILRLVQSIPSKKAEPFKMWLAQVGSERLDEIADPQKAIDRAVQTYRDKGYPEEWITQRMMTIKMRKELTAEWQERGITQEKDYAILTNEMTKAWSGLTVQEYKKLKDKLQTYDKNKKYNILSIEANYEKSNVFVGQMIACCILVVIGMAIMIVGIVFIGKGELTDPSPFIISLLFLCLSLIILGVALRDRKLIQFIIKKDKITIDELMKVADEDNKIRLIKKLESFIEQGYLVGYKLVNSEYLIKKEKANESNS